MSNHMGIGDINVENNDTVHVWIQWNKPGPKVDMSNHMGIGDINVENKDTVHVCIQWNKPGPKVDNFRAFTSHVKNIAFYSIFLFEGHLIL